MRSDHLRGLNRRMSAEEVERHRLLVLRNDAAWIRDQMTNGRGLNSVYLIDHARLMRVVGFMETELKQKLGESYVVGKKVRQ